MTTSDDFQRFHDAAFAAAQRLGLGEWQLEVQRAWLPSQDDDIRARVYMNWIQRTARIVWNENAKHRDDDCRTQTTPEEHALHEVLHILLNTLVMLAEQRPSGSNEVLAEEHAVINRLMGALK